jgi:hypothetical protein
LAVQWERLTVTSQNAKIIAAYQVGMWLSLVERLVRDQEAAGSNPVIPTILIKSMKVKNSSDSPAVFYCVFIFLPHL